MQLTNRLAATIQNLIYLFFILWIGILAPLTYFNPYSVSHRVLPPYRIALLNPPIYSTNINALPETLASQVRQQLTNHHFIAATQPSFHLAHSFESILGTFYLSPKGDKLLPLTYTGPLTEKRFVNAHSAYLPRPKKPPRLFIV